MKGLNPYRSKLTSQQVLEICSKYISGVSSSKLAVRFDVGSDSIRYRLHRAGIRIRTSGESNRRYSCNYTFFDTVDTEPKAYWLGFIAADGCVMDSPRYIMTISLSSRDKCHLIRLKEALESNHNIRNYHGYRDSAMDRLVINSKNLVDDLIKHGIHPRKTHTLEWPNFLSDELLRHYLRGYMDGDGGLYIHKSKKNGHNDSSFFSVASNEHFLLGCQGFLIKKCSLGRTKLQEGKSTFVLRYGGNRQVKRIFDLLYDRATIWLPRKRDKIEGHLLC